MQEKELRNTFCERLRKRREEMNITRKEFAGAIGVSVAAVGMYETGDRLPPLPVLVQIARVLHTSTDELIGYSMDALPEYERYKCYLESIGAKVIESDGGEIDVIPADSKGAHAVPLFGDKEVFCGFMQEVKRNAGKETKNVLEQKTNDALKIREREIAFMSGLMEIADKFPDDRLKQKDGKVLLIVKLLSFVAKYQGLDVTSMQEGRDK